MRIRCVPTPSLLEGEAERVSNGFSGGLLAIVGKLTDSVLGAPQRETGEHKHGNDSCDDEPTDKSDND